jgi:hypothetical protein
MTYAAYLRIYEPLSAFPEPDRSRWAAYADSSARPSRRDCLAAEHAEALRRAIATPPVVVPEREGEHAYIRHADGLVYVCPWQTRLRCLLAEERLRRLDGARLHILASVWTVPLAWFVPFAAAERWLVLGSPDQHPAGPATASVARALVYTTAMPRARKRVARGLAALRRVSPGYRDAAWDPVRAEAELTEIGRWLEEFYPYSLVELDYGGLVHLLTDDALCGDESVAEIGAAIDGVGRGECELAVAMYKRAESRWRAIAGFESAN